MQDVRRARDRPSRLARNGTQYAPNIRNVRYVGAEFASIIYN